MPSKRAPTSASRSRSRSSRQCSCRWRRTRGSRVHVEPIMASLHQCLARISLLHVAFECLRWRVPNNSSNRLLPLSIAEAGALLTNEYRAARATLSATRGGFFSLTEDASTNASQTVKNSQAAKRTHSEDDDDECEAMISRRREDELERVLSH